MKKFILPILLFLMFIPFVANAETCDTDKITISSITVENKSDNVEELETATASGKNINLNLSMTAIGDNIEYKFLVKNNSNEDYELDKTNINLNSNYIDYSFETEDNSNIIKAKSTKTITLKIEYKNKIPEDKYESGRYNDNKTMTVQLSNGNTFNIPDILKNPNTGNISYIFIITIILLISGTIYILFKRKKHTKFIVLIIVSMIIVPISVYAICKSEIIIKSNIIIDDKSYMPCTFDGDMVQGAEFVYGDFIYRYKQEYYEDKTDWNLKWRNINEDGWGVIYKDVHNTEITGELTPKMCSSINGKPIVSMSYTFYYLARISKFDASYINTSNVVNMSNSFYYLGGNIVPEDEDNNDKKVELIGLENWNVSKVKNMHNLFYGVGRFAGEIVIDDISKWDTSSVEDMSGLFLLVAQGWNSFATQDGETDTKFDISGIENWDVSNVKDMSYMFEEFGSGIKNLEMDFSKWDVSSVENFEGMLEDVGFNASNVKIKGLENWNVSKGINFDAIFLGIGYYSDTVYLSDLSRWNVSNAESMSYMFEGMGRKANKVNLFDFSNWDTRKVKNMSCMFSFFGEEANVVNDIGTLNVYAEDISSLFKNATGISGTVNIYSADPKYQYEDEYIGIYGGAFENAATNPSAQIIVNYSNNTTDIDSIIATKSENSNVVKGTLLSNN